MSTRKLKYPANEPYPESIDDRLEMAHLHHNKDLLDNLTPDLFNQIVNISNKLNIDLSNIDLEAFYALLIDSKLTFPEAPVDGKPYARENANWLDISNGLAPANITSSTLTVIDGNTKNPVIELSLDTLSKLSEIDDKATLPTDAIGNPYPPGTIVIIGNDGDLEGTELDLSNVLTQDHIINDYNIGGAHVVASAESVMILANMIKNATLSVGKVRGSVYNALTSMGTAYAIADFAITAGGTGYVIGDIVGVTGGITDGVFVVTNVSGSSVTELDLVNEGAYSANASGDKNAYGGSSGANGLIINIVTMNLPKSTLAIVEDPFPNDTCYVLEDETHNGQKSIWVYAEIGEKTEWLWLMSMSDDQRDFYIDPIKSGELENNAVTNDKLGTMPPMTVKGNNANVYAAPSDIPLPELAQILVSDFPDNPVYGELTNSATAREIGNVSSATSLNDLLGKVVFIRAAATGAAQPCTLKVGTFVATPMIFFVGDTWQLTPNPAWVSSGNVYAVMYDGTRFVVISFGSSAIEATTQEAQEGTVTDLRSWSPFKVHQAINYAIENAELPGPLVIENTIVENDDSILIAIGKLQGQINNIVANMTGFVAQTTSPANTKMLWIDTSLGRGVLKYWTGSTWRSISTEWT